MLKVKNLKVKILLIGPSEVSMDLVILIICTDLLCVRILFKTMTSININIIHSVGRQYWRIFSLTQWRQSDLNTDRHRESGQ